MKLIDIHPFLRFPQQHLFTALGALASMFKTSAQLRLENLALRQQLTVLRRPAPKRLKLTPTDRIIWVWSHRVWADWKSVLMIVKAETVVAWHRKGFRLFWTWKIHRGQAGRPSVPQEVRDLIRMMSRNNPRWRAPRIHGELLKLGIELTEPTVAKYMVRHRKPPSQTWRTFLDNHVKSLVSAGRKNIWPFCPRLTFLGTTGRFDNSRDLLPQNGSAIPGSPPHFFPVDPEVSVNQNVSKRDDFGPWDRGMNVLQSLGQPRRCLADDRELLNYGAAHHPRFLKSLEIDPANELGDMVRSLEDVAQI